MNGISFTVHGLAKPAGSKRAFVIKSTGRAIVTDANPNSREWKNLVRDAAQAAHGGDLIRGPVVLTIWFYFPRPKGHFGSGKNASKLKESSPSFHCQKPDCTKLVRGAEDALKGVIWVDDSQVVQQHTGKAWGEPARCEIKVEPLAAPPPG